jgi:hypothetical protein
MGSQHCFWTNAAYQDVTNKIACQFAHAEIESKSSLTWKLSFFKPVIHNPLQRVRSLFELLHEVALGSIRLVAK